MADASTNNNLVVIIVLIIVIAGGFAAYKKGYFTEKHDVDITLPGGKKIQADVKE